jgi:hypothetical protein
MNLHFEQIDRRTKREDLVEPKENVDSRFIVSDVRCF